MSGFSDEDRIPLEHLAHYEWPQLDDEQRLPFFVLSMLNTREVFAFRLGPDRNCELSHGVMMELVQGFKHHPDCKHWMFAPKIDERGELWIEGLVAVSGAAAACCTVMTAVEEAVLPDVCQTERCDWSRTYAGAFGPFGWARYMVRGLGDTREALRIGKDLICVDQVTRVHAQWIHANARAALLADSPPLMNAA